MATCGVDTACPTWRLVTGARNLVNLDHKRVQCAMSVSKGGAARLPSVGTATRTLDDAIRRAARQRTEIGHEFRERRLMLGQSQGHVAASSRMSRNHYGQIEGGSLRSLTIDELNRIAAVLGLAPSLRLYPDGVAVRDVAHASRLTGFLGRLRPPLTYRVEVPLPMAGGRPERRAWDAVLFEGRRRCAVELEMRLRDIQAARRRIDLKRRDDPTESFLLLVADTRFNRRVLAEFRALFADLPRLRPSRVREAFEAGEVPPTALLLI
jgi:transcriptional regulator with XRE-family HTH domain